MNFIEHTMNWTRGELLEATLISVTSLLLIAGAGLFWKYGTTPAAKGIILPLLVVGLILGVSGVSMLVSNQKRLVEFEQSYQQAPAEFVLKEKERVESFLPWYKQVRIMVTVLLIMGMAIVWFSSSVSLHGIAIGLTLFAISSIVIDHFSNERAQIYYQHILEQQKVINN